VLLICGIGVFDIVDSPTVQHRYIILQSWEGFGVVNILNEPTHCIRQPSFSKTRPVQQVRISSSWTATGGIIFILALLTHIQTELCRTIQLFITSSRLNLVRDSILIGHVGVPFAGIIQTWPVQGTRTNRPYIHRVVAVVDNRYFVILFWGIRLPPVFSLCGGGIQHS
jgi:hypothetical protein